MPTAVSSTVFDSSLYLDELRTRRKESVLQEIAHRIERAGAIRDSVLLAESLVLRERLGTTAIGKGVALPNVRSIAVSDTRIVVARSSRGIDWGAEDGVSVQLVFAVLSPAEASIESHHELLARVAHVARLQKNRARVLEASSFEDVAGLMREVVA